MNIDHQIVEALIATDKIGDFIKQIYPDEKSEHFDPWYRNSSYVFYKSGKFWTSYTLFERRHIILQFLEETLSEQEYTLAKGYEQSWNEPTGEDWICYVIVAGFEILKQRT